MTDRELLEAAAEVAGMEGLVWWELMQAFQIPGDVPARVWSPLAEDGDALRLAVKLGIIIDTPVGSNWVYAGGNNCFSETSQPYPFAATRRAIVRAAADIGATKEKTE